MFARKFNPQKMVRLMSGAAHKVEKPETIIETLEKAPRFNVIVGSIAGAITSAINGQGTPVPTLSDDWKRANKEYMIFQNMNPISGISKKH